MLWKLQDLLRNLGRCSEVADAQLGFVQVHEQVVGLQVQMDDLPPQNTVCGVFASGPLFQSF